MRWQLYHSPDKSLPIGADYYLTYWSQYARLDMRDDPVRVSRGYYLSLSLQEAGYLVPSSWNYIRVLPELRGYAPLPGGKVSCSASSTGRRDNR